MYVVMENPSTTMGTNTMEHCLCYYFRYKGSVMTKTLLLTLFEPLTLIYKSLYNIFCSKATHISKLHISVLLRILLCDILRWILLCKYLCMLCFKTMCESDFYKGSLMVIMAEVLMSTCKSLYTMFYLHSWCKSKYHDISSLHIVCIINLTKTCIMMLTNANNIAAYIVLITLILCIQHDKS